MKIGALVVGLSGFLSLAGVAGAQEVPRPHVGFQMDLRTGYSIPLGTAVSSPIVSDASSLKMSDLASGQVPFIIDIGAKVIPELFLGGYFGLGFGGEAGAVKAACDANGGGCVSVSIHLGVEAQYHILPGGSANPWLGYGIGFESLAVSQGGSGSDSIGLGGFEFARFMGGVDFRVNRVFGVGPFVDLSLGRYSTVSANSVSTDLTSPVTHEWLTLGARFVFFP
jgi:hypothetical protein